MAGGTRDEKASTEACQGASDRLLTWLGRELGGSNHVAHTFLKLALTSAAPRSISAAMCGKLHP